MTLFGSFVAHEATTQFRSARFRAMALVYVIAACAPVAVVAVLSRHAQYFVGSATYATVIATFQPFLTMLFVGLISVDAITRERDEGSFPVVSLAPLGAAGYLFRRWIAVMAMTLPLTVIPPLVGAALAAFERQQMPLFAALAWEWLLRVLPVVIIISALALALGTINGNTIVAIIVAFFLFTFGLEIANDFLAFAHRRFDGPGELTAPDPHTLMELQWSIRGYYSARLPTDAGYPLTEVIGWIVPRAALGAGIAALLLGLSTMYLRRTRRDLRPWRIRPDHPLRSFLATANRLRTEYSPDGSIAAAEWVSVAAGVAILAGSMLFLSGRASAFERLGDARYDGLVQRDPLPMSPDLVPLSVRIRGSLARDGEVRTLAELAMRNSGGARQSHLAFALNALMNVVHVEASAGRARLVRRWDRLGIDVEPPLEPGETRTLRFELAGRPGGVDLPVAWGGGFRAKWHRYMTSTQAIELSDLSRSQFIRDIDETRVSLPASDFVPLPRYSAWEINPSTDTFTRESIEPAAALDVELRQPFDAIADSCGHVATRGAKLGSRCTMSLASYRIAGGPLSATNIGPGLTLAFIPAHESLARVHGAALAGGVARAEEVWPGLALARPIVYVEDPTKLSERPENWRNVRRVSGSGMLQLIPEALFTRFQGIEPAAAAASLITNSLRTRRRVVPEEAEFFATFYELAVMRRLSPNAARAVVPAVGNEAVAWKPLLETPDSPRFPFIAAAIESRAGANHIVEAINDFVAAGPRPGTARELFDDISRRSGVDLTRMFADFVAGEKTPRLTLTGVTFRRAGGGWEVRGELRNEGTGEAFCPIALRTAAGSQWQTLRVDTGASVPFVFTSAAVPHTLQLDPDRVCYRQTVVGATESVDNRSDS